MQMTAIQTDLNGWMQTIVPEVSTVLCGNLLQEEIATVAKSSAGAINYTPVAREDYRVGVPKKKQYRLILNSKDPKFGGDVPVEQTVYKAEKQECDGKEFSFAYPLPAYGVAVFVY